MEAYLPNFCYNDSTEIKINGVTVHYVSAINVDPDNAFDARTNINMLIDLNRPKSGRLYYPACAGTNRVYASYHILIDRDGTEYMLVPLNKKAFHAGASSWQGYPNCNMWMAGIALIGTKVSMFTTEQYNALAGCCKDLSDEYGFPLSNIVGHEEIAPGRKFDPGIHNGNFDKQRLIQLIQDIPHVG